MGISYLDNLKADVASGRFVVLKGADFRFTTLSGILHSKKRGLSHSTHEFLFLLRPAKKISQGKNLDGIMTATKKRGSSLVSKSQNRSA